MTKFSKPTSQGDPEDRPEHGIRYGTTKDGQFFLELCYQSKWIQVALSREEMQALVRVLADMVGGIPGYTRVS